jgi:hypothetical protein
MIRFVTKPRDCVHHLLTHKSAEKSRMKESPSEGGQLNQAGIREKRGGMWPHLWPQNPRPRRRGGASIKMYRQNQYPPTGETGGRGTSCTYRTAHEPQTHNENHLHPQGKACLTPHQTAPTPSQNALSLPHEPVRATSERGLCRTL